MAKSRDAFRTISEVADWLDTPAHVLRFWESKFTQIKPIKRAGGRRYYRPQDMELLSGIKTLLHDQGMTIKGAQKLLREKGVKHVSALGAQLEPDDTSDVIDIQADTAPEPTPVAGPIPSAEPDPNDPWPADPWPNQEAEAPVATAPAPAAEPMATPAKRSIPTLPDAAAAKARPGILATALSANPALARKNRAAILPLMARLEHVQQRSAAS